MHFAISHGINVRRRAGFLRQESLLSPLQHDDALGHNSGAEPFVAGIRVGTTTHATPVELDIWRSIIATLLLSLKLFLSEGPAALSIRNQTGKAYDADDGFVVIFSALTQLCSVTAASVFLLVVWAAGYDGVKVDALHSGWLELFVLESWWPVVYDALHISDRVVDDPRLFDNIPYQDAQIRALDQRIRSFIVPEGREQLTDPEREIIDLRVPLGDIDIKRPGCLATSLGALKTFRMSVEVQEDICRRHSPSRSTSSRSN